MAGRAKIIVNAKELDVYEDLIQELKQRGHSISDNSRIKITYLSPYTQHPAHNISAIIAKLDRYISINGNKEVTKKELSKILGISRPTLDDWIRRG